MNFESSQPHELNEKTSNEAFAKISIIGQNTMSMGANDVEAVLFNGIKKDLLEGRLRSVDAIRKAQDILDGKQDYH